MKRLKQLINKSAMDETAEQEKNFPLFHDTINYCQNVYQILPIYLEHLLRNQLGKKSMFNGLKEKYKQILWRISREGVLYTTKQKVIFT